MERMFTKFLSVAALLGVACSTVADNSSASPVTQFNMRPQSWNKARQVSGEVPGSALTFLPDMDNYNGYFGLTVAYDRTFRPGSIARSLFGDSFVTTTTTTTNNCDNDCDNYVVRIQGSQVASRDSRAWLADNFYLPADYNGTISFNPNISNVILDFNWYMGLDEWVPGMYFRLYGPFVHTKWNLNFEEQTPVAAGLQDPAGLFTPDVTPSTNLLSSALSYFAGSAPTPNPLTQVNSANVSNAANYTTTFNPLAFGKMLGTACTTGTTTTTSCDKDDKHGSRTKNGFGELRAELGWNFWQCDDWHLGLGIQAAAPTGSKIHGEYLFDGVIGNGRHWELGGLLTAHYVWWRSTCEDKHFGLYLDANLTHLFKATENRVFDLKGKPLSRYMLAAKHSTNVTNQLGGGNPVVNAQYQFTGEFVPVANLTAHDVNVSVGVQADVVAWFDYTCGGFSWDLGYNYYGRSCEKISDSNCQSILAQTASNNVYALKGDAYVYGYQNTGGDTPVNFAQPLSISESKATLQAGTCTTATPAVENNGGVDNAQLAVSNVAGIGRNALFTQPTGSADQTNLSLQPTFLSASDINLDVKSRQSSNKIFSHINYKWDRECWSPYIGLGGEAEFGQSQGSDCNKSTTSTTTTTTQCDSCRNIAVSQWGVWFKLGVAFN